MLFRPIYISLIAVLINTLSIGFVGATELTDNTFLIAKDNSSSVNSQNFWDFFRRTNFIGIEVNIVEENNDYYLANTNKTLTYILSTLSELLKNDASKIIPVFLEFNGDILKLDSIINESPISSYLFYLPQGETWPSFEYLIQANRRIIFFLKDQNNSTSRIMHVENKYILQISAKGSVTNPVNPVNYKDITHELLMVTDFDKLPTQNPPNPLSRDMDPDYINFLLNTWTNYGKRPNFIFVGKEIFNFNYILEQLKSFTWINGTVKVSNKIMEKVYWKNPDVSVTGGKFSFPYRGGEEFTLSPFFPGYKMTPEHIVVTGEMDIPENYTIIASPLQLSDDLTGSFNFEGVILNNVDPPMVFSGENFSFSQDIERGNVLRLPEDANVNLGAPDRFGLRNSSFTVSCFVKFTEILEYGDNAVLGNYESGYRRGLHLIIRSSHPYFGLWANDFVSEEKLDPNIWYHLTWRYILETGEQAIFLNGNNIGSSEGHPPFSGTGDIHLGSALLRGASLRGYIDDLYIWKRPLGSEEINRLALDENVPIYNSNTASNKLFESEFVKVILAILILVVIVMSLIIVVKNIRNKKGVSTLLPPKDSANQIQLFGKFRVLDKTSNDITSLFTPKVKELFLYVLLYTLKTGTGPNTAEVDEKLWPGLSSKKVVNNRAVTLNKLRKILDKIDGVEVSTNNSHLVAKLESPLFCDYEETFKLSQSPGGMTRGQLETFFKLVEKGRFLRGIQCPWLDEMRGYTGNQVIDNLLKLAAMYIKENKLQQIDAIARRILEYDDLNEEAIYLQIWTLQKTNNLHLAKFNFESFRSKYKELQGEEFNMDFDQFTAHYADVMK